MPAHELRCCVDLDDSCQSSRRRPGTNFDCRFRLSLPVAHPVAWSLQELRRRSRNYVCPWIFLQIADSRWTQEEIKSWLREVPAPHAAKYPATRINSL